MTIRRATELDTKYLAESCVQIARFMRESSVDKFILGLPDQLTPAIEDWARSHTETEDKVAFVAENPMGKRGGCICGHIEESIMPMSISGHVGKVAVCWVKPEQRQSGLGRALVAAIEDWFLAKGIRHVEVAYMARNETAKCVWTHLGYTPFRIFAYKEIGPREAGRVSHEAAQSAPPETLEE